MTLQVRNFGLKRTAWIQLSTALVAFFLSAPTWAAINLQRVQMTDEGRVDLVFDGKVDPNTVRSDFFNDTVQLSLDGVNVYPAKISNFSGPELVKIFAYQYSPGLVRCRFTLKGKAEDYKDRLSVSADGKVLSVRFGVRSGSSKTARNTSGSSKNSEAVGKDSITQTTSRPDHVAAPKEKPEVVAEVTADERTLLERVLGVGAEGESEKTIAQNPPVNAAAAEKAQSRESVAKSDGPNDSPKKGLGLKGSASVSQTRSLGGAPELPSPVRALGALAAICGGLGLLVILRKSKGGTFVKKLESHKGLNGLLGSLGIGGNEKLIEVLSNHPLGTRKSIAVVRVGGRRLVLGVTNEAINLITALDQESTQPSVSLEKTFANALAQGVSKPASQSKIRQSKVPTESESFDLESLARESADRPELFRPGSFAGDLDQFQAGGSGSGATIAGAPRYSEPSLIQSAYVGSSNTADASRIQSNRTDESSLQRSSAIRDRIKNRLGGMKQL